MMVYMFRIASVMLSVWVYCVTANNKQRRLVPIADQHHHHELGNDHSRSLLSGSLLLYLHGMDLLAGERNAVELEPSATIKHLRQAAADAFDVEANAVEVHFQGHVIHNDQQQIADSGISNECVVQVTLKRNDIDDLLAFFGDSISTIYRKRDGGDIDIDDTIQRIHEMKREAIRHAADANNVDFVDVIEFINTEFELALNGHSRSQRLPRIHEIICSNDRYPLAGELRWKYLPRHTKVVKLFHSSLTSISLRDIECAELEVLFFHDMSRLTHLDLRGIEKCTSLRLVRFTKNAALRHIDLSPWYAACPSLHTIYLSYNALQDLDLSPLSKCHKLKTLVVAGNPFPDGRAAEIVQAFRSLLPQTQLDTLNIGV